MYVNEIFNWGRGVWPWGEGQEDNFSEGGSPVINSSNCCEAQSVLTEANSWDEPVRTLNLHLLLNSVITLPVFSWWEKAVFSSESQMDAVSHSGQAAACLLYMCECPRRPTQCLETFYTVATARENVCLRVVQTFRLVCAAHSLPLTPRKSQLPRYISPRMLTSCLYRLSA